MSLPLHLPGIPSLDACEGAAEVLREAGGYRVLRPLVAPELPDPAEVPGPRRRALLVNTQTTGLDPQYDDLLEVAVLPIEYAVRTGQILWCGPTIVQRRDIGRSLYPDEVRRASITSAELVGQRIDERFLHHASDHTDFVISFAAEFHRKFLHPFAPNLAAARPWACAFHDVPWGTKGGYRYQSLPALLASHAGMYLPETSHAAQYVMAVLVLLGTPFKDASYPMQHLLDAARGEFMLMPALGVPHERNRELKARGYRYYPGKPGTARGWYKVVRADDLNAEKVWQVDRLYNGRVPSWSGVKPLTETARLAPFGLLLG